MNLGIEKFIEDLNEINGKRVKIDITHKLYGNQTIEYDLCVFVGLLDVFGKSNHRRRIVGYERKELRERGLDVSHECGTAGACKEALFGQLL